MKWVMLLVFVLMPNIYAMEQSKAITTRQEQKKQHRRSKSSPLSATILEALSSLTPDTEQKKPAEQKEAQEDFFNIVIDDSPTDSNDIHKCPPTTPEPKTPNDRFNTQTTTCLLLTKEMKQEEQRNTTLQNLKQDLTQALTSK